MKKLIKFVALSLVVLPAVVSAAFTGTKDLVRGLGDIVEMLTIVAAGVALLVFFWGLIKYILAQGSEASKIEAKKVMGWGLVALFVMVSVWGIINFFQDELFPSADFTPPPSDTWGDYL